MYLLFFSAVVGASGVLGEALVDFVGEGIESFLGAGILDDLVGEPISPLVLGPS